MIGTYDYRITTEAIAESYNLGQKALGSLICAFNTLQLTDVNEQQRHRRELDSYLRTTYAFVVLKHLDNQQTMYAAIRALNNHVLIQYGYDTIDDFLLDNFIDAPITYAILSEQTGEVITVIGDSRATMKDINRLMKDIDINMDKIGWENV